MDVLKINIGISPGLDPKPRGQSFKNVEKLRKTEKSYAKRGKLFSQ